ncbi:protein toll-like [Ostrinia nubilalis]|uniref:protein toll-like n=1 Tax=Ostrinia nubilalis TaxID=29057 RepID=UPI003082518C
MPGRFSKRFLAEAALLFLAVTSARAACPAGCRCAQRGGQEEYRCERGGDKFVVIVDVNERAQVYCKGGRLSCASFPQLTATHNGVLPTLQLDSCLLPDSLACLLPRLGAGAVGALRVEGCSELTGSHVAELKGLQSLWILDTGFQKTLPFDAIARLPTLIDLHVKNSIIQLTPSLVQNTHLQTLELGLNHIREIPPGTFRTFPNLTRLFLYGNKIENISEEDFDGLHNLRHLDLCRNPLRTLRARVFASLPGLRRLTLAQTGLEVIKTGAFEGLADLEEIDIKASKSSLKFESLSLSNLPRLKHILIHSTPLYPLPEDLFTNSKAIYYINITKCGLSELPRKLFRDQRQMKILDLSHNNIEILPEEIFWPLDNLAELNLTGNLIEVLPWRLFEGLTNLKSIFIDDNRLSFISPSTFNGPKNLNRLSLRNNQLMLEDGKEDSPFGDLSYLEEIDLSGNLIRKVFDDWRLAWVHSIRTIDLSRNRIRALRAQDVEFLGFNVTVDLRYNNITTIAVRPNLHDATEYDGATFLLGNNPINCNCDLHPFLYFTRHHQNPKFVLENTLCTSPNILINNSIHDLPLESLYCDVNNSEGCPESCSCKIRPETSTIEFDCSRTPPLGFPDAMSVNMKSTKVRIRNIQVPMNLPENAVFLDLHNLSLTEVPDIPDGIVELDLRNNDLTAIPEDALRDNLTLYLAGNKISCSCWNKHQIDLLYKSKDKIKDYDAIVCNDGSYLAKLEPGHLCDVWWATVVGSALAAAGLLAAVVVVLVYYRIRKIEKFIYTRGWPLPPFMYEEDVDNRTTDVLISYPDSLEKFVVTQLVPLLRRAGFSVSLRCVNWDVGDYLPVKVTNLVEDSRRTLVLLSNDYFESDARLELRAALMDERRSKRKRVLLVLTEELQSDPSLDRFIQTRNNLSLRDDQFWEQLLTQLPRKRKPKAKSGQKMKNVRSTLHQDMLCNSKMSLNRL